MGGVGGVVVTTESAKGELSGTANPPRAAALHATNRPCRLFPSPSSGALRCGRPPSSCAYSAPLHPPSSARTAAATWPAYGMRPSLYCTQAFSVGGCAGCVTTMTLGVAGGAPSAAGVAAGVAGAIATGVAGAGDARLSCACSGALILTPACQAAHPALGELTARRRRGCATLPRWAGYPARYRGRREHCVCVAPGFAPHNGNAIRSQRCALPARRHPRALLWVKSPAPSRHPTSRGARGGAALNRAHCAPSQPR